MAANPLDHDVVRNHTLTEGNLKYIPSSGYDHSYYIGYDSARKRLLYYRYVEDRRSASRLRFDTDSDHDEDYIVETSLIVVYYYDMLLKTTTIICELSYYANYTYDYIFNYDIDRNIIIVTNNFLRLTDSTVAYNTLSLDDAYKPYFVITEDYKRVTFEVSPRILNISDDDTRLGWTLDGNTITTYDIVVESELVKLVERDTIISDVIESEDDQLYMVFYKNKVIYGTANSVLHVVDLQTGEHKHKSIDNLYTQRVYRNRIYAICNESGDRTGKVSTIKILDMETANIIGEVTTEYIERYSYIIPKVLPGIDDTIALMFQALDYSYIIVAL